MENKKYFTFDLISNILLIFAGGFISAYTYILNSGTYASMHTGNLIKFLIALTNGEFSFINFMPLITFNIALIIAYFLLDFKWSRIVSIITQILCASVVLIFPNGNIFTIITLCILSVSCAFQFIFFNQVVGQAYTGIMCTNNMRLLEQSVVESIKTKKDFKKPLLYLGLILTFSLGVVASSFAIRGLDSYSLAIIIPLYIVIFFLQLPIIRRK